MNDYQSLRHSKWECKYHVVFIPKYRRKVVYGQLRRHLGEVFRELARQQESVIVEGICNPITCIGCSVFRPSMRWRRWWGISKGRVRFTLPGRMGPRAEFRGGALLGTRLLGLDGRAK